MMWGFLLPKGYARPTSTPLLRRFQPVITDALARVGLGEVAVRGLVRPALARPQARRPHRAGRRGVRLDRRVPQPRPPDLTTYLQVVRIPDDKFKDKVVKDMTEYVCTAEEVAGRPVTYEQVRDALVAALAAAGIVLEPSG